MKVGLMPIAGNFTFASKALVTGFDNVILSFNNPV